MSSSIIHKTAKYFIRSSTPTVHCGYNWRFNVSDTVILNFLFNCHRKEVMSDFIAYAVMNPSFVSKTARVGKISRVNLFLNSTF